MEKVVKGIQKYSVKMENYQEITDRFSTVSVKIMYSGKNRNDTYFERSLVESKIESLKNMPVVGEFSEENDDFKGHGGKMVISDEKIDFLNTTRPYGLVPESMTHEWVQEDIGDGRLRDTLVVHGVILWTKHYPEAWKVLENHSSQSMEIDILKSVWDGEIDAFKVQDFNFQALCILGENVIPAFENSHFYSLQSFKDEFAEMLSEFKNYTLNKEDNNLEDKDNLNPDLLDPAVEPKTDPVEPDTTDPVDPTKPEDPKEPDTTDPEDPKDPDPVDPADPTEPEDPAEPDQGEPETVDLATYQSVVDELETAKSEIAKFQSLNTELTNFKDSILRERHEDAYAELLEKYKLSDSDVELADIHSFSIDEIDEKLKVVIAEKVLQGTYSLSNQEVTIKTNKVKVDTSASTKNKNNPYGDLFEEFGSED